MSRTWKSPASASTSSATPSNSAASYCKCKSPADLPLTKERGALRTGRRLYDPRSVVIRESRGSCSLLQRALGIGYGRAARLIDFMAEDGIVGEFKSGSAREVLYNWEEWEALKSGGEGKGDAAA